MVPPHAHGPADFSRRQVVAGALKAGDLGQHSRGQPVDGGLGVLLTEPMREAGPDLSWPVTRHGPFGLSSCGTCCHGLERRVERDSSFWEPFAEAPHFREAFFACLTARRDELFELADALLCADGPVTAPVDLTLLAEHRRGHGALYDALESGRPSWCQLLDAVRLDPEDDVAELTARQVRRVVEGDPGILIVFDVGYDARTWPTCSTGSPLSSWDACARTVRPNPPGPVLAGHSARRTRCPPPATTWAKPSGAQIDDKGRTDWWD